MNFRKCLRLTVILLSFYAKAVVEARTAVEIIQDLPGLVALWTFEEEAGENRISIGPVPYELREGNGYHDWYASGRTKSTGQIERRQGGPISGSSAYLRSGQYFYLPNEETGALNIHGEGATLTLIAFVKGGQREPTTKMQFIAGMWDEVNRRQYGLLTNVPVSIPEAGLVYPHISFTGTANGFPYCINYAANKTPKPVGKWVSVAMTYDGEYLRSYLNGLFEERQDGGYLGEAKNPYHFPAGIGDNGADFTVGGQNVNGIGMYGTFVGQIDALMVFDRCLSEEEVKMIHDLGNFSSPLTKVSNDFENNGSQPLAPNDLGWKVNASDQGVSQDHTTASWWVEPAGGVVDPMSYFAKNSLGENSLLWHVLEEPTDVHVIKNIRFRMRNSSGNDEIRIAIRIGDEWYLTKEGFTRKKILHQMDLWLLVDFDFDVLHSLFNHLSFVENSDLSIGGSVEEELDGMVTAIGIYTEGNQNTLRVNRFEMNLNVNSIDIPQPQLTLSEITGGSRYGEVTVPSEEGLRYNLSYSKDLEAWRSVSDTWRSGDGSPINFTIPVEEKGFYRVLIQEALTK